MCKETLGQERVERNNYTGVDAVSLDKATASRRKVTVGEAISSKAKRLKKVYASGPDARAAAQCEYNRNSRATAKINITFAYGRPDIGRIARLP